MDCVRDVAIDEEGIVRDCTPGWEGRVIYCWRVRAVNPAVYCSAHCAAFHMANGTLSCRALPIGVGSRVIGQKKEGGG